jgi:hypothetical protein
MAENAKDTQRAFAASKAIIDGRDILDPAPILVTVEHAVASVLLLLMGQDPRKAAAMLNKGLVQGIEHRLALFASRAASKSGGSDE